MSRFFWGEGGMASEASKKALAGVGIVELCE